MSDHHLVRGVHFRFKYIRSRLLLGFAAILAIYLTWLGLNPTEIDFGHATGAIDLFIRSLPGPARAIFCCASAVYLSWSAYVTYWPCIREGKIRIYDGRNIHGFDLSGAMTAILKSEVETVSYRYGGASVRGGGHKLWVPLSLLDTDEANLTRIKDLLNEAAS